MKKTIFGLYQNLSNTDQQRTIYAHSTPVFSRGRFVRDKIELYDEYMNPFSQRGHLPKNQLIEVATDQLWEQTTTGCHR